MTNTSYQMYRMAKYLLIRIVFKINMTNISEKSYQIFYDNIRWLFCSGIRIKNGHNRGAIYGWKNLNPPAYPFIYSEIAGYAVTCFSWIYTELGKPVALQAAKESADWIIRNMRSCLLVAGSTEIDNFDQKGELSNQIYSFDNGIIIIGLLNLYKITRDPNLLTVANLMTEALIERFFDGSKLTAILDASYEAMINDCANIKWSTISGAYHSKLAIAFLELSRLTNNMLYAKVSNSLCDYAKTLQKSNGRFITNSGSDVTYLHPHLYACEGLIYAGITQSNENYYRAGLKGVTWAIQQINPTTGGLPRDTGGRSIEQSDCIAQLLRLSLLCRSQLQKYRKDYFIDKVIDKLCSRLLDFYIPDGQDQGGMRYQLALESACSWCTMFSMQALALWGKRNELEKVMWINYYI
jgi:hypothetical protein